MAVSPLTRLSVRAPVPVFAATGVDGWGAVQELRADPRVRLAVTPRHAAVLLVAGAIPPEHHEALRRVHDQVPRPRTVVAWSSPTAGPAIPAAYVVKGDAEEAVSAVTRAFARILADPSAGDNDLLPDEEPNEWRGVGPFGQGGEGMMGGTPYGRPMAMTGDDRDGLALDRLRLRLGPFLDQLPPGLVLDVVLQGDVVQAAALERAVTTAPVGHRSAGMSTTAARRGLQWLAHALHVQGLDALGHRAAALARRVGEPPGTIAPAFGRLVRRVKRSGVLWTLRGVGVLDGIDAAGRWDQRLDAVAATLRTDTPSEGLHPPAVADDAVASVLVGMTLTDAVSTVVSVELPRARRPVAA